KDEAENLPEFVRQAREALLPLPYPCEIVVIDDGSRDGTADILRDLAGKHPFLRVVSHRSQRGIADALASGADAARGRVLVFYPADLQYRPSDIPSLVQPILDDAADVVTGTKQGHYEKRFVSWVYNGLCRLLFGVRVTDLNSVKAYRREVMDGVTRRPDWHRFLVGVYALFERYALHQGNRAFLYLVLLLVLAGLILFGFGFVGEMLAGLREEVRGLQREMDQLRLRTLDDSPPSSVGRGRS